MTTTTRRRSQRRQGASRRYLNMAVSASTLGAAGCGRAEVTEPGELLASVEQLAGGSDAIVWVHETAAQAWGLPERLAPDHAEAVGKSIQASCRSVGDTGWSVVDGAHTVHLAFPAYSGDFAGLDTAGELLQAVEAFRHAVGFAYVISGAKTVHTLIETMSHPGETELEPELDPPRTRTAWAVPANQWGLADLEPLAAAGRTWVRCFDRVSSYLAVWQGTTLSDGEWVTSGAGVAEPGPESSRPAGYWLVDPDQLPAGLGSFDPWRQHGDRPGPRWITTPLLQLAVDIADSPVAYDRALVASGRCRALDKPGARLRDARIALEAQGGPPALSALRVVKNAYSVATSWFADSVRPPSPLARPCWTHTIHDRHVASCWRSLEKAVPGPFAFAMNDTALFALDAPGEIPDGLRCDGALGSWKPKGDPIAIGDAIAAGGPIQIIKLAAGQR